MNNKTFDRQFVIVLTIFILLVIAIVFVPYIITSSKLLLDFTGEKTAHIGDSLGGMLGPFVGIVAAGLTFLAFWVQYKANEQQREYIRKQRFEDTFFRLLENHQRIVEAMDLVSYNAIIKRVVSKEVDHTESVPATVIASNRDCFKTMYNNYKKLFDKEKNDDIDSAKKIFNEIQEIYKSDLHHYFRFIYRIIKFVHESDITLEEKYEYTSIFRAVFNPYELVMLFYNGLHDNGVKKFKPLLEEYSFLKNLDKTLLLHQSHSSQYHELALPHESEARIKLYLDWKKKRANTVNIK